VTLVFADFFLVLEIPAGPNVPLSFAFA
jgi:hypothetical protein